jgi:hypothetical protein
MLSETKRSPKIDARIELRPSSFVWAMVSKVVMGISILNRYRDVSEAASVQLASYLAPHCGGP